MNLNNQFERAAKVTMQMTIMRNIVRNLCWHETRPGLYETTKPLNTTQSLMLRDLINPLKIAGRLTPHATVMSTDQGACQLVLAMDDLLAFGDVVDFEKIHRLKPAPVAPVMEEASEDDFEAGQIFPLDPEADNFEEESQPFEKQLIPA